jgi:hypothetical protein
MAQATGTVRLLTRYTPVLWGVGIVFFGVADLVSTFVGLYGFERAVEASPVVAALVHRFGLMTFPILKIGSFVLFYAVWRVVPRPYCVGVPLALATLGVLVTVWNAAVLLSLLDGVPDLVP